MLNYTTMSAAASTGRFSNYDILSDLAGDLRGLQITLLAIADQPCVIEPEQIHTLSALVGFMTLAVRDVMEHLPQGVAVAAPSADRKETPPPSTRRR